MNTDTELSTLSTSPLAALVSPEFLEMSEAELNAAVANEIRTEGDSFEYKMQRIVMPSGKSKRFTRGDDDMTSFEAAVVVAQKGYIWYPGDSAQALPPACASPDRVNGFLRIESDDDQMRAAFQSEVRHPGFDANNEGPHICSSCPLHFNGCKSNYRTLLWVRGEMVPTRMNLPAMSCDPFDEFTSRQFGRGGHYFTTWVKIELEAATSKNGTEYRKLKLSKLNDLNIQERAVVLSLRKQYEEYIRSREAMLMDDTSGTVDTRQSIDAELSTEEVPPF